MKIEIRNLGPISEFNFDLQKDFHIIYGENNIGKSYAISTVYILLKYFVVEPINLEMSLIRHLMYSEKDDITELNELISSVKSKLTEKKLRTFSISKYCETILKNEISKAYIPQLQQGFKNSFSNLESIQNKLSKEEFQIKIILNDFQFVIKLSKIKELYIDDFILTKKMSIKFINTNREIAIRDKDLIFYIKISDFNSKKLQQDIISSIYNQANNSLNSVKQSLNNIYYFPASRSGLYQAMNIFGSVFAKLSQLRHVLNSQIDIPAL